MALEFKLPDVGEGLHEAELIKWMVEEGDQVTEDQPLMEVQTDKATVEITSPYTATIAKLMGKPGDILHVHSVVVVFDDGQSETAPAEEKAEAKTDTADQQAAAQKTEAKTDTADQRGAAQKTEAKAEASEMRALAAPATRWRARELGININQVRGTGPAGRVTPEDLKLAAEGGQTTAGAHSADESGAQESAAGEATRGGASAAPGGTSSEDERIPLRGIRKVIAERMVTSKHTAAHVTTVDEVDMTELVAFRERAKEMATSKGVKLSYLPFIIKALITALKEYPYLNARIDDEKQEIILRKQYHVGFALDTDAGLLVPVIHNADRKSILQIASEMQQLIDKGRVGKLQPEEMRGSTFTLSNQGSIGGLFFTPVINHPEVAILGVGQTQERPAVRDGQIVIRKMAYLALSFDHRLIDGAVATRFLNRVVELLGDPTLLMMEGM